LPFTPADFCIGESGVWFFSLMWEHGKDAPPVEFLDDSNLLAETAPGGTSCTDADDSTHHPSVASRCFSLESPMIARRLIVLLMALSCAGCTWRRAQSA
jgi:hypothetical protein